MDPVGAAEQLLRELHAAGVQRSDLVALTVAQGVGLGVASAGITRGIEAADPAAVIRVVESDLRPRWVWWSNETPAQLLGRELHPATCWDLAAVHRLLFGGWPAEPARIWAALHDLSPHTIPGMGQLDLLAHGGDEGTDAEDPIRPDGHLRPEWIGGGWMRDAERLARWAGVAAKAAALQRRRVAELSVRGDAESTARSESAAELLCAELSADGLPLDRAGAEQVIATIVGPRPRDEAEAALLRRRRDADVLRHLPAGAEVDLRNNAQVRTMLGRVGIDVPDTRSWRLEAFAGAHPVVAALLSWRKAERVATTYGYPWLAQHVGADDRLRGAWSGSDGAAGRMTAQAGLHNLPAEMRPAVAADAGHVLVRADLGQIEPRVLAAVSGDRAFAQAAAADDLYAPVAARLAVERPVAKIAVLAAMYGQTSGAAGEALRGLESAYPVAMRYLRDAYDAGRAGRDVRTYGGRLVRMWATPAGLDDSAQRAAAASRGRFARNAVIQGAAAEFFKAWAVTVRAGAAAMDARIVLCLHDELLVHAPAQHGAAAAELLQHCLVQTARHWAPSAGVRFVADISVVQRWSEAKA